MQNLWFVEIIVFKNVLIYDYVLVGSSNTSETVFYLQLVFSSVFLY